VVHERLRTAQHCGQFYGAKFIGGQEVMDIAMTYSMTVLIPKPMLRVVVEHGRRWSETTTKGAAELERGNTPPGGLRRQAEI
jgi:hypothetical protein